MTGPMGSEELRELLREAAAGPTTAGFEAVYRRVRRRRLLRRGTLLALTAAVAAAAVTVPSVLLSAGQPPSRLLPAAPTPSTAAGVDLTGAVRWLDAPEPPYVPLTVPPTPPPAADARPCAARDVTAGFASRNGWGGHLDRELTFRNVSSSTCVLIGFPQVTASEPGQPDVHAKDGLLSFTGTVPANMAPGQLTSLELETTIYCPAVPGGPETEVTGGPVYEHISVAMPGGGTVRLTASAGVNPGDGTDGFELRCGLRETKFFVGQPEAPQPHDPLTDLQVSLELPATVRAGSTLSYVADLTNPTGQPISLARCPGYLEFAPPKVKQVHALNCAPVGAIAAHSTARFEMQMMFPEDIPAGTLAVHWRLSVPGTSDGNGSVDVVAAPTSGTTASAAPGVSK
jgi:hypothetical protein